MLKGTAIDTVGAIGTLQATDVIDDEKLRFLMQVIIFVMWYYRYSEERKKSVPLVKTPEEDEKKIMLENETKNPLQEIETNGNEREKRTN